MCSQWNALAEPFLYERILISNAEQLEKLAQTLSMPSKGCTGTRGSYVVRLDLAFRWSTINAFTSNDIYIFGILELCTRLLALNVSCNRGNAFHEFSRFADSIPRSIEYLYWYFITMPMHPLVWVEFLDDHPHLKVINVLPRPLVSTSAANRAAGKV